MSRRSLGTLTIDVIAEVGGFVSGMDASERRTKKWRNQIEKDAKAAGLALGGALAGGITSLAAGIAKVISNSSDAEREIGQLDAILKSTGGAAGLTRQQLLDMADTLSSKSTFSGGEIVDAQTRLLSYSGVLGKNIPRAMQAVVDQSARLGISVSQSAETIGRALESPGKAAAALAQSGFGAAFTKEVRGTIDQLVKAGKEGEAQVMILEILEESYGGAAMAARDTFGGALLALRHTLNDLTTGSEGSLKGATDAVNALVDSLQDQRTKDGFEGLITFASDSAAGFFRLTGSIADFISKTKEIGDLDAGGALSNASEGALEKQMVRLTGLIKYDQKNTSGFLGLPLTSAQDEERLKRINDHVKERLDIQRELTRRYQYNAAAESFKGVTATVDSTAKDASTAARDAAEAAAADAERNKKAIAQQAQLKKAYEATLIDYQRKIELISTDARRIVEVTELEQARFEIASGKFKEYTAAQKADILVQAELLDKKLALKKANEEAATAAQYAANLQTSLATVQSAMDVEVSGAGLGAQARDRARQMLQIEADYQQKRDDLFRQYQAGDITQGLYDKETSALQDALDKRLDMQRDHFQKLDALRSDSMAGMADAWADYATNAADRNQQAYDAVSGFLNTTTGDVADSIADLVKGNESLFDSVKNLVASMGDTVINTLAQMAAQWLVYQSVQMLVGKTSAGAGAAGLTGNAMAMSAQAALAAYASTAAIPIIGPALAPGAAAAATAATAPLVAMVSASALVGMAHDGIDKVPQTGTWLLQQGERVTTAATSAKLDATLDRVNRDVPSGGSMTYSPSIYINGNPDQRTIQLVKSEIRSAITTNNAKQAGELASGSGKISKAYRSGWNGKRRIS